jgi:aldose 1-epimerase
MITAHKSYEAPFHGEKAVWLTYGPYEAAVLPQIGANLIAFRDTANDYRFIREPSADEMEDFKKLPYVHGIPVLFPPNRYVDGKFPWDGKCYHFPVNEPSTGNHLHGFLYNVPWTVEHHGTDPTGSHIILSLSVSEDHPVYAHFPHAFTIKLRYSLSDSGLLQHVSVRNDGERKMPCLLGFHTAINAPFAANASAADYRFKLTIGQRWELDDRMLPTGKFQPLLPDEEKMKNGELSPFFAAMDNHYTAEAQNGRNRMELTDTRNNVTLVYDVGTQYKQWMIWNNNATAGFFCPEPQINVVNAPSVPLPAEKIGLLSLRQGEIWEATSRLYCIPG